MACFQSIPCSIMLEASMYVGMQAESDIQKTAKSFVPQLRSSIRVGAMAWLK
jgi:hypothetical protein